MSHHLSRAGAAVAGLAERATEPGRLSRGRALFRKGAVLEVSVTEGSIVASVRGGAIEPYVTTIGTAPAPRGVVRQVAQDAAANDGIGIDGLIADGLDLCPRDIDLAFDCNCADWDEACKHVIAVLLAFADRVDLDETELLRWRGVDPSPPSDEDGPDQPSERSAKLSELQVLLGDTAMEVRPADPQHHPEDEAPLSPTLARFFAVDAALETVEVTDINPPPRLFDGTYLGPLADLGPELASAIAIIADQLADQG